MLQSLIIMFRETLEAALVVGIVLGYLSRTKLARNNYIVYLGIIAGLVASVIGAVIFTALAGGFSGRAEEIFEGIIMLLGAFLLTTMILWMMRQRNIAVEIEQKVAAGLTKSKRIGLFFLVFISILREGLESVIFLSAASFASPNNNLPGALAGFILAALLAYLLFRGSLRINIKKFFTLTNILLILFAGGLIAQSLHELQEAGVIPVIIEHVWDINPPLLKDGGYPFWHEKGYLGSIARGLLGYNGNPSLLEITGYGLYLIIIFTVWRNINKEKG